MNIIYDGYNSRVKRDQMTTGALTTHCGCTDLRTGVKIIELEDKASESIVYDGYNSRVKGDQLVIGTLTSHCGHTALRAGVKIIELGHIEKGTGKHQSNVVYSSGGIAPTLCAGIGVKQQPTMSLEVKERHSTRIPYISSEWEWNVDGKPYLIRIRKITPKEAWLLMGFSASDFAKVEDKVSQTQQYKQAGNSICKDVLVHLLRNLNFSGKALKEEG